MINKESPKLESRSCEPFDPEAELKELRKDDKETRTERLEKYKQELIKQKEGIAEIQEDLEKQIRENPDLSQEELMKTVLAKAPKYKLSENQLALFEETLNKYVEKHRTVREARKQYPHGKELFKACFGKEPEGTIEIIERPASLYFRCHDIKDYAWTEKDFSRGFPDKGKQKLTKSDINNASMRGGHLVNHCLIFPLQNTITVENARGRSMDSPKVERTLRHEEQHVINSLFREQKLRWFADRLLTEKPIGENIIKELHNKKSPEILINYLRFKRENFENSAKDEILAFYKGAARNLDEIMDLLVEPKAGGGIYDYFDRNKDYLENSLKEKLTSKIFRKNKKIIRQTLKQVFVNEYQQEIIHSINAINELEKMGKSRDEIIHLLITEPLSRWGKLVQRIKETKK